MGLLSTIGAASGRAFGFTRSAIAQAVDAYFNLTTLLLPGNGTNGTQNNTFQDSSTNNFSITRNPTTGPNAPTQGTFSPFSQTGWSNAFSVSGTYLTATQSAFAAAGDFTVEAWFWQNNQTSGFQGIVSTSTSGNSSGFRITTDSGTLTLWVNNSSVTSASVPQNQWNHVAISRTGTGTNNISCYLNGVRVGQFTNTSSTTNTTLTVGRYYYDVANYYIDGYISNVRLVVGSGLHSGSTISVPTTPLTAVSGTQVLTCQSNRFIDSSSNAFALTVNGTPSVQPFSPFNPTAAYSAATVGGSGYFDGTGDYLTAPSTSGQLGSGDFTIECWSYLNARVTSFPCIWGNYSSFGAGGLALFAGHNAGTTTKYNVALNGTFPAIQSTDSIIYNQWTHLALVRSGTTVTLYVNGVANGTTTSSATLNGTSGICYIGSAGDDVANGYIQGYLSNLRVVVGTAVYTSAFTPPTAPLTAITNTKLLLNTTNAGITDATAKNDLETVGGAQISTTQSKFGGSSMYFDGTGDYLTSPNLGGQFDFRNGDFTIELWVFASSGFSGLATVISKGPFNTVDGTSWTLQHNTAGSLSFYGPSSTLYFTTTSTPWTTGFAHIAICRSGSNTRLFVNGTQQGSTYTTLQDFLGGNPLIVGSGYYDPANRTMTGYIDDLRISKYARYTANFTAPTSAFALQ